MTRHLITGAAGQLGRLLAESLVAAGEDVVATGLEPVGRTLPGRWCPLDVTDSAAVRETVRATRPDVVHHLAGMSSVAASWEQPELADALNRRAALTVLQATTDVGARFVLASSSDIFGPVTSGTASECTPLDPQNPYAEAKAAAHVAVQEARLEGALATNLVLFGHTSPLQEHGFVIPTVCRHAVGVVRGQRSAVELQNPRISRDWGAATDAADAFARAATGPSDDYVIATGRLHSLLEVAEWALVAAGVTDSMQEAVRETGSARPGDVTGVIGDATRARDVLGWTPRRTLEDVVTQMVRAVLDAG